MGQDVLNVSSDLPKATFLLIDLVWFIFPPRLAHWFCNNLDNGSKIGLSLSFYKGHFF